MPFYKIRVKADSYAEYIVKADSADEAEQKPDNDPDVRQVKDWEPDGTEEVESCHELIGPEAEHEFLIRERQAQAWAGVKQLGIGVKTK